jgi:hypothetical protein
MLFTWNVFSPSGSVSTRESSADGIARLFPAMLAQESRLSGRSKPMEMIRLVVQGKDAL